MDKNLQKDFIVHKGLALSCSVDVSGCNQEKVGNAGVSQDFRDSALQTAQAGAHQ